MDWTTERAKSATLVGQSFGEFDSIDIAWFFSGFSSAKLEPENMSSRTSLLVINDTPRWFNAQMLPLLLSNFCFGPTLNLKPQPDVMASLTHFASRNRTLQAKISPARIPDQSLLGALTLRIHRFTVASGQRFFSCSLQPGLMVRRT